MTEIIQRTGFFLLLIFLLASCSATKQVTEQEVVNEAIEEKENEISEQKQKQFEYMFVEALKHKMFGNVQEAVQHLSACLEIDPNSSAAMFELANIHALNNDFTSAALLLEKAIDLNPENKWYKQLLAQIYQQSNQFRKAAEIYSQLLELEPENLNFLFSKAMALGTAKAFNEAIEVYDQMEKITGINEQVSVAKQQLYVLSGSPEKAFEEIEKLITNDPNQPKYYGLLADLYLSQGDRENALKYYSRILEMDPENGFVHFSLANFYLEEQKPEQSFEETKKGFNSESVDLQTKLQLYMMITGNREQSKITNEKEEELIQILLKNHPDEFMVHTVYADNLLRNRKLEEGREQLLKALELQNSDYMIWERVLFIDNDLQDWESLYEHSKESIELFPNQPQVYFLNGVACVQLEKYEETIDVCDEGLDFVVDNPQLQGQFFMLKGEALYKLNRKDEAYKLFDKAVLRDPENYIALNNYAYYLSLDSRDLDKAEKMSGQVVKRFPDNSTYLDTHAWVLFKKGEYSLAKFYMESAIKNGGEDNPVLLEHLGDILFMMEKKDEAKEFWEKAKLNGGTSEVLLRKIKEEKYFEE